MVTVVWHSDPKESEAVIESFLDAYMLGRQVRDKAMAGLMSG